MNWWRYFLGFFGGPNPDWVKKGAPLRSYKRRGPVDQGILHESGTPTTASCVKVLNRRKLGVHYSIDRDEDGTVRSHVPIARACSHAGGGHNHRSIGIEIINNYYSSRAKDEDDTITAIWAHKKGYILPLESQMISLYRLYLWLIVYGDVHVSFPGIKDDAMYWGRTKNHQMPGTMAHHRFHHADGLFPECYLYLRTRGMDHTEAWSATVKAAKAGKRKTKLITEDLA